MLVMNTSNENVLADTKVVKSIPEFIKFQNDGGHRALTGSCEAMLSNSWAVCCRDTWGFTGTFEAGISAACEDQA